MTESHTPARTRYAPSPTGRTHLGNLRTAMFSWLLARHTGGQFILRIEDTDRQRLKEGAQEELLDALRWIGLNWDEGPDIGGPHPAYVQSANLPRYAEIARQLVNGGHAYYCDCSKERLDIVRRTQQGRGKANTRYDNHCRDRHLTAGPDTVIRFRLPDSGSTEIADAMRGFIRFENKDQGDPVILKSDGYPTYHLAAVVDDHDMHITHVLRGDEWLPSAPIHVNLYRALGWQPPTFAHLPLVVDINRQKIKKRSQIDATESDEVSEETLAYERYMEMLRVATLRERGYLPAAVFNFMAFLGWHPGTTDEIMSVDEVVARFSLERLSTSPAVFDVARLNWFNQQHMKRLSSTDLSALALPFLRAVYGDHPLLSEPHLSLLIDTIRDDIVTVGDVPDIARFAFVEPDFSSLAPALRDELHLPTSILVLNTLRDSLPTGDLTVDGADALIKSIRNTHKLGGKQVFHPIRVALTGTEKGPHLSNILALLGPERCRQRISQAIIQ